MHLIRVASPCYLWTITCKSVVPDGWFGNMHRQMVTHVKNCAVKRTKSSTGGTIPRNWGGVRVFEPHPLGHGLHAHWVMRGRMDWHLIQACALKAGLGPIIHVDPKPVKPATAYYLAKYLTKGDKLHGVRQWANIGTWDGIGKRDIVIESTRIDAIKAWQRYFRLMGKHRFVAYQLALDQVDAGHEPPGTPDPF